LGEAFTKNCVKIYESTANGYNDYQKMWESGVHINCFYEWWRTKEYFISFPNEGVKEEFLHHIRTKGGWIWDRLRWLKNDKELSAEQLYWYWNKYDKYLDKDLIKQEYPCTEKEAFLLSGQNVFDTEIILQRLEQLEKPIKTGYFVYDYNGLEITNIKWIPDRNGYIKIYSLPNSPEITEYCIGGDTAGSDSGEDYFIGQVLDARTGKQVSVLRHRFDSDLYAKQMYCLGKYYKNALIGIEANFDSFPIMELQRLGYPKQYVREAPDTYTGKTEKRFGFRTTSLTRPTILSKLVEIVREHCDLINDRETLEELLSIVRNEKGRIEAPEGGHDDLTMALAIAHHIREQVVFPAQVVEVSPRYNFNVEKQYDPQYDYGGSITVI
jgi:hypothetical protein